MFCTSCGNEVKPGQLFCTACGAKIVAPVQNNQSYQNNQGYQGNQNYQSNQTYQTNQNYQSYRSNQPYQSYQPYLNYDKKKKPNSLVGFILVMVILGVIGLGGAGIYSLIRPDKEDVVADNSSVNPSVDVDQNTSDDVTRSNPGDSTDEVVSEPANNVNTANADPNDLFAGYQNLEYKNYSFANVAYGEKALFVVPSGNVNDHTVLRNGKTAGEFADFVDNDVLEDGRKVNRELFYDLISVYLVDPTLSTDDGTFEKSMVYLTTFANQFYNMDVSVEAMSVPFTEQDRYRFKVKSYGNDDIWIADPNNNIFYFNNGNTEYNSSMYDESTLSLWLIAVDVFFGIGTK